MGQYEGGAFEGREPENVARTQPIEELLNRLNATVETLHIATDVLRKRLDPVIANRPEVAPTSNELRDKIPTTSTYSDVGSRIRTCMDQLTDLNERIRTMTNNLEI